MTGANGNGPIRTPFTHAIPVRVYWEDTDAGGIVYHASHIRFFERGRTEYLRALGVSQSDLAAGEAPLFFAVRRMETDYLKPARLDDLLEVTTATREIGGARMTLDQVLTRGADIVARAVVTVVAMGADGRPHRIPAALRALFGVPA